MLLNTDTHIGLLFTERVLQNESKNSSKAKCLSSTCADCNFLLSDILLNVFNLNPKLGIP